MQDLKHALRLFAKTPGFTVIVAITLALGIGANVAIFSIIQGTLLHPLPYKKPDRLISILDTSKREKDLAKIFASYADFENFSRHSRTLESLAADTWAGRATAVLTGHGQTRTFLTIPVTPTFFEMLGIPAQIGRIFHPDDIHNGCSVVLSDKFWRTRLNADRAIIGQPLALDNQSCTVLGVMPATFAVYPPQTQIWTLLLPNDPRLRNFSGVFMIGLLKDGASIARAQSELTSLHTALHGGDTERDLTPLVSGLQSQFTWLASRTLGSTLALVFAAALIVFLIAALNIASLLISRAFARRREFATRAALGLGGAHLFRQLLAEASVLSVSGAVLGVMLAVLCTRYVAAVQPVELPVGSNISLNLPALVFAAGISLLTAVFFAVFPAFAISRGDLYTSLRTATGNMAPERQRLWQTLVAAQMALSVILLSAAGLLMQSVLRFQSAPLGFAHENILASNGSLPDTYADKPARTIGFYNHLQQKLAGLPGVTSATVASTLPPYGLGLESVEVEGKPVSQNARLHDVGEAAVDTAYFQLFEIPILRGRVFRQNDDSASDRVAIVNKAFADEYFGTRDPVGQKIRIADETAFVTVVGVVGNEKRPTVYEEMTWATQPAVYRPIAQHPPPAFAIAVRTAAPQTAMAGEIEKAIESVDPQAALGDIEQMQAQLEPYLKYPRFRAALFAAFSFIALALASVGLYGLLAQFVAQRTIEIGVRKAVGAVAIDIAGLIVRKGGVPVLTGLVIGIVLSLALTRYLRHLVYEITPTDPATFSAVVGIMLAVTVLAMIVPTRRALRLDPIAALRSE